MRYMDLVLTESSLDDTVMDIEDDIANKVENGVLRASLDEYLDELNDKGAGISKSLLRKILESLPELVTNVSDTEIEFNTPGNVPDEMVPEPEDMEQNVSNLATSAAEKGIGDELNV